MKPLTNKEIADQLQDVIGLLMSIESILCRLEPALIRAMPLSATLVVPNVQHLSQRIVALALHFKPPLRSEIAMKADKVMEIKEGHTK